MTGRSMEKLKRLLGEWRMDVEGTTEGRPVRGAGTVTGKEIIGNAILLNVDMEIEGQGPYQEVNLFAYSEEEERVHQFTVGSYGQVHDHVGGWRSEDILYVEWSGISGGKPITEKIRYEWKGRDNFEAQETDTIGGKVVATYIYRFSRASPPLEEAMAVPT